jgi:hypothetical protein
MFKDLEKSFPHINEWLDHYGSIEFLNVLKHHKDNFYEAHGPEYSHPDYKRLLKFKFKKHLPTIHVLDHFGFVWEDNKQYGSLKDALIDLDKFLSHWIDHETKRKKFVISIDSFVKTGQFGPIELNMHRTEIERILGRPEGYGYPRASSYYDAGIWWYGSMEIRFGRKHDKVGLIYNYSLSHIGDFAKPSRGIELTELFFFENDVLLNHKQIEEKLIKNNIKFQYYENVEYDTIDIVCESGVEIYFNKRDKVDGNYVPYSFQRSINPPEHSGFRKIENLP